MWYQEKNKEIFSLLTGDDTNFELLKNQNFRQVILVEFLQDERDNVNEILS